jgi:hypothetical protein
MDNHLSNQEKAPAMPVWMKLLGAIAILLIVVMLIMHVAGGGMNLHMPPSSVATEQGMQHP